jgi:N6-L-threonylcarbamoyladenine synthase
MNVLSIETSCDETGIALLKISGGVRAPKVTVLADFVSSQIKIHRPFGGVVPNLAKREHLKNLPILFKRLQACHKPLKFDLIAVTVGPGLEPALWTGITFAQALAKEYKKPLIGANHLEGHLYSFLLPGLAGGGRKIAFPAIALIVSGGHTLLLKMDSFTKWQRLGETRDDAAGEAFDKVARMLKLNYPGGPEIEKLAKQGKADAIAFPRPMIHDKNYDFSFSGLKTSVLYYLRDHENKNGADGNGDHGMRADVAASFQQAAVDVLVAKTIRAARDAGAKSVILCGGVAANKKLRSELGKAARKIGAQFFVPPFKYNLDNGAMIGLAGYMAHERKKRYKMVANGTLEI